MVAMPPPEAIAAVIGPSTRVTRRIDIYEADGTTLWREDVPPIAGSINVDHGRDERRTLDLVLSNLDGDLDNYPGNFWYDKIIKPYRGVTWLGRSASWVNFDGTATSYVTTPDSSAHNFDATSGVVTQIIVAVALSDWTPATIQRLAGKWGAAGSRAWRISVTAAGMLELEYSVDGTASQVLTSTAAPSVTNGNLLYLRFDFQVNNGASGKTMTPYTSPDGLTWTPLGAAVTSATGGASALFDSNAPLMVGASDTATTAGMVGTMTYFSVYTGVRAIVDLDMTGLEGGAKALTDAYGLALTLGATGATVGGGIIEEQSWEMQLGEFMIDTIVTQDFPHTVSITGRDYTAKLLADKFEVDTTFVEGSRVVDVIRAIALNGGIDRFVFPPSVDELGRDFLFERKTERWKAMVDIATAYGYELFFDHQGFLVMEEMVDPATTPEVFTFETGEFGTLASYSKEAGSSRIYNVVVVSGESSDTIPVYAIAKNEDPDSPTSVAAMNREIHHFYTSAFITTTAQAQAVADKFLKVLSLESFQISITAITIPWLEVGTVVTFLDPDPNPGDPTRFLLTSFDVPLGLGGMSATAKRVTLVA